MKKGIASSVYLMQFYKFLEALQYIILRIILKIVKYETNIILVIKT